MTREQAKQVLIGMGVAEPSEEQVSKLLDSISAETKKEKDKNVSLKEKAEKADSLEKELEELKTIILLIQHLKRCLIQLWIYMLLVQKMNY